MSLLSKGIGTVFGGSGGTSNPFAIPDLSFLKEDLTKKFKPVDTSTSDSTFRELLNVLGGQDQNDTEALDNLLSQLDVEGENKIGSTKSDFLDRGLGGPGQISDIEANALAQNRADTEDAKAGARVSTIQQGLNRLNSAYGSKYQGDLGVEGINSANYNDLLKTGNSNLQLLANLLSGNYNAAAKNQTDSSFPSPFFMGFGKSFGENLGKNAAGGTSDLFKAMLMGG
jgi:hypothetical protein